MCVAAEIFQHKEGIPDPKTHYLLPFRQSHIIALQIVNKKNFSEQKAKPTEARLLCEVSIAKVILQAQDIFRGKLNCIPDFRYLPSFAFSDSRSDSSCSSPVTASLVAIVTHTQLFLSHTSILMCNSFLSN